MVKQLLTLFLSATFLFSFENVSATFTDDETRQVEKIIHDYLLEHPEILSEVATKLRIQQKEIQQKRTITAVMEHAEALFDSSTPLTMNDDGQVSLVEFLDYRCGHCLSVAANVSQIQKDNQDVRVILMPIPILGKISTYATRAVFAADHQGASLALHHALMNRTVNQPLTKARILQIAKEIGLSEEQLEKDIKDPEVIRQVQSNLQLATSLHLKSTPAFIIAQRPLRDKEKVFLIPGAVSSSTLQNSIEKAKGGRQ